MRTHPYLQLLRPANVVTAAADVVAGYGIAGSEWPGSLPWLVLASGCLYAGGVVLNDVFDRTIDAVERPDRPIPSGRVTAGAAARLGGGLLVIGIVVAAVGGSATGLVAVVLSAAVLLYDAAAKRHHIAGPVVMGACRGLNLALGLAASTGGVFRHWSLPFLPWAYTAGITIVSRGEVKGGGKAAAGLSFWIVAGVVAALGVVVLRAGDHRAVALAVLAFFGWRVLPAFRAAYARPDAPTIRAAVKRGVLSLVLLDAVLAAAYAGAGWAVAVLATGLLAGYLARSFAVT